MRFIVVGLDAAEKTLRNTENDEDDEERHAKNKCGDGTHEHADESRETTDSRLHPKNEREVGGTDGRQDEIGYE